MNQMDFYKAKLAYEIDSWDLGEAIKSGGIIVVDARSERANGDTRIFLALGGQILVVGSFPTGLVPAPPPEAGDGAYSHGFGVAHFGLRVADVAAAIAELSDSGVRVLSQPVREPSGLTYAYVAAPDGVVVELTHYESAD